MQEESTERPLRVAMFTEAWPPIISGVSVATRTLVEGLRGRGHTVDVYAPYHPEQPAAEEGMYRLPSVSVPIPGWIPISLPQPPGALGEIARRGYDVAHTQHPFTLGRAARALARRRGIPLVATVHTQYEQYVHYWSPWHEPGRRAVRRVIRDYCNSCSHVTTVAAGIEAILRGYGVTAPVSVIPNDVDLCAFLEATGEGVREEWGVGDGEVVLLSVSRLAAEKNLEFLLEAVAPLLRGDAPARLVFIGDGPLKPDLERLAASLGLADRVLFPGRVDHAVLPRCYAAADVFLMASVTEVNPLTIGESLAAGTPVVAVDSFSAREALDPGRTGLITGRDAGSFRDAVRGLMEDAPRRERIAAAARDGARARGAGSAVASTEALYRRLLAGTAPR